MGNAQTLTRMLGGNWSRGYGTAACPVCQTERRPNQRALSVQDQGGKLLVYCHKGRCRFENILLAAGFLNGSVQLGPASQRKAEVRRATYVAQQISKAKNLWAQAKPIHGTNGAAYLQKRGITCPLPDTLRWLPDTYHGPSGRWMSAIVALVEPTMAVHRTFFEKSGQRVAQSPKLMLGPCAGGAVRLTKADGPTVVAEGIETALSLASGLLSYPSTIWAALSASGMKALQLPLAPGTLFVATDGDNTGREAGFSLAQRASALGWKVSLLPASDGCDWNDILQSRNGGAV